MSESLGDLLQKRSSTPREPVDFAVIRKFVQDHYSVTPKLSTSKTGITISVPTAAIASNLRFDLYDLQQSLTKHVSLRIRITG